MSPRRAALALAAFVGAGARGGWASPTSSETSSEPSCPAFRSDEPAKSHPAPGLVLMQEKFVASVDSGKDKQALVAPAQGCARFSQWPHVDNEITCIACTALVQTAPYNRCDRYCESFGHVCVAAAEEKGESCAMKHRATCNHEFTYTSDMLCTCRMRTAPPVQVPRPGPVCGSTRGCDHCPSSEAPLHAGCFVMREGKLLAHRITYGSRKFDLPGGQTNWREPASCTAHRETYEETGYEVTPTELLAGGLHGGGFNLYRCELLKDEPSKGPDHEVSGVWWLSKDEVAELVRRGWWRFSEASRYVEWMR